MHILDAKEEAGKSRNIFKKLYDDSLVARMERGEK